MRRWWKRLGLWVFGFDLDTEFLRGVGFGGKWREEQLAGDGSTSVAGSTHYVCINRSWDSQGDTDG